MGRFRSFYSQLPYAWSSWATYTVAQDNSAFFSNLNVEQAVQSRSGLFQWENGLLVILQLFSLFPKLPPKLSGRRHKHWKIRLSVDWALLTLMHTVIASHYMTNDSHEAAVYTFSVPFRRGHFRALAIDIFRVEIACVAEALSPKQYTHLSSTFSSWHSSLTFMPSLPSIFLLFLWDLARGDLPWASLAASSNGNLSN